MGVLELHTGGRDPENVARIEEEAATLLDELKEALPVTDSLRAPVGLLAEALALRVSRREFHERRAAREAARKPLRPLDAS